MLREIDGLTSPTGRITSSAAKQSGDFALESDLVSVVQRSFTQRKLPFAQETTYMVREFHVGMTIPDLLFVVPSKKAPSRDVIRYPLSLYQSSVISAIKQHGALTIDQLSKRLFSRVSTTQKAVLELKRLGLLGKQESGLLTIRPGSLRNAARVVAIEAKLTRWREAIQQALSYLRFSNMSFVALPKVTVIRTPVIANECRTRGLGLISVDANGCEVVVTAKRYTPSTSDAIWVSARLIGIQLASGVATRSKSVSARKTVKRCQPRCLVA